MFTHLEEAINVGIAASLVKPADERGANIRRSQTRDAGEELAIAMLAKTNGDAYKALGLLDTTRGDTQDDSTASSARAFLQDKIDAPSEQK